MFKCYMGNRLQDAVQTGAADTGGVVKWVKHMGSNHMLHLLNEY